jgi:hypothetical protein
MRVVKACKFVIFIPFINNGVIFRKTRYKY